MKTKLQELFEQTAKLILNRLEEFDELSSARKEHIRTLIDSVKTRSGDEFPEIISSYVMALPVLKENGEISLDMTLHMPKTEEGRRFISVLYHEIMHIISIGELQQISDSETFYRWGICSSRFYMQNGILYDENFCEYERLNESLTDLSAEYFYYLDTGDKYKAEHFKNRIMRMCKCDETLEMKAIVASYIKNDESNIRRILAKVLSCNPDDELDSFMKANFLIR